MRIVHDALDARQPPNKPLKLTAESGAAIDPRC
jgi:hypothetical protein